MRSVASPSNLLDEVMYLASLVSQPRAVDPILDVVRGLTARLKPGEPPPPQDVETLGRVRAQLQAYLIEQEPLRTYTGPTLEAKMFEHFQGQSLLRSLHIKLVIICISLVSAGILPQLLPQAALGGLEGASILLPIVYYGAPAWLFISALKDFAPKMKTAYVIVCLGICALGVAAIVEILFDFYNPNSSWARNGGEMSAYWAAFIIIYAGFCRHARLMEIQSWFMRPVNLLIAAGSLSALLVLVPAVLNLPSSGLKGVILAVAATSAIFVAMMAYRIWRASTALYARAMRWIFWAFAFNAIAVTQYFVLNLFIDNVESWVLWLGLPYTISSVLLLVAGYVFNKVGRY